MRWALLSLVLAGVMAGPAPAAEPGAPVRRILLISVDTLSAAHLSGYGYGEPTSSVLDSLASHGMVFRHCLVPQVWTLSSHMSLFTGLAPGVHRVGMDRPLADSVPTLAERLAAAGMTSVGFYTSNYWLGRNFGFARSFSSYRAVGQGQPAGTHTVKWLEAKFPAHTATASWFAFVHYMDVHTQPTTALFPYEPTERSWWRFPPDKLAGWSRHVHPLPPDDPFYGRGVKRWDFAAYGREFLRDSYDDCIRYWDGVRLRRILGRLRAGGFLDDTLIIITADHGEEFLEHGNYVHKSPHVEVREVPLVVVWPGRVPAGCVVDARVSLMDLAPTILDLAGLEPLPAAQGISLRPVLENPAAALPDRDFLIDGDHRGYRQESSALVARLDGTWWMLKARCDTTGTRGTFQPARVHEIEGLYDLDRDPGETRDLRSDRPEVVAALRQRLTAQLEREAALARQLLAEDDQKSFELSDEQKRKLKALGY